MEIVLTGNDSPIISWPADGISLIFERLIKFWLKILKLSIIDTTMQVVGQKFDDIDKDSKPRNA